MIKTYKIRDKEFQTIIIPKGTVLFRGLSIEKKDNYPILFNDIIGLRDGPRYAISPTMNVFFYPVPYVSDIVNIFNVHIMYLTQYDIELIMLVSPSTISRGNKDILDPLLSPIATCNRISEYDKCGYKMSEDDPCLTDIVRNLFPQIAGYIGLAAQDIALINKKYKDIILENKQIDMAKQIIPAMITNSRGLSGIPEIVIHPLHSRQYDCILTHKHIRNLDDMFNYCRTFRAQNNYFPLLYFTNNGIFTFNDLQYDKTIELIAKSVRTYDGINIPQVYKYINDIFSKMLNTGYKIENTIYNVVVDRRTGFYVILNNNKYNNKYNKKDKKRITYKKIPRENTSEGPEGYLDSYIVKSTKNAVINTILSKHDKYINEYLLKNLNLNGYSLKKKLVFNRKKPNRFVYNYYIDKVLDRPDLDKYIDKRQQNKNITRKKIDASFATMLDYNGLTLNDLDEIESVGP
jgi:hypothetical protein